jgi:hypothetical protein
LFKQQGAIRALGTAVIAAHPGLAEVLDRHGLTLDPVSGEVVELEPFNTLMSKRAGQVERNLADLEATWAETHPGQEPGPVVTSRMVAAAWAKDRPQKRPTTLVHEDGWRQELTDTGYEPGPLRRADGRSLSPVAASPDDLQVLTVRPKSFPGRGGLAKRLPNSEKEPFSADSAMSAADASNVAGRPVGLRVLIHRAPKFSRRGRRS